MGGGFFGKLLDGPGIDTILVLWEGKVTGIRIVRYKLILVTYPTSFAFPI